MPRGGRRPGSGRPKKGEERKHLPPQRAAAIIAAANSVEVTQLAAADVDAKLFLERVMSGLVVPSNAQMDAARSLLPFQHKKLGETGKKEQRKDDAAKVGGKFQPAPPRLAVISGKKV